MRRLDRLIIQAFVPTLVLLGAGLAAMLAFWGVVDSLPWVLRFVVRWLPLALIVAGLAWGAVTTLRLWRRARTPAAVAESAGPE